MKRSAISLVILVSLLMSGCLVSSLHPFYKKSDVIYDKSLLGSWLDTDSALWIIEPHMHSTGFMQPDVFDNSYKITYYEEKDSKSVLHGTLFELRGKRYVDFFPEQDEAIFSAEMTQLHFIPVHTLARIQFKGDTIMFFWFGEEWLNELFENNRIRIDHEIVDYEDGYKSNILTADTDALQKFIIKYMDNDKIGNEIEDAFDFNKEADKHVFLKLAPYDGPLPENE